MRTPASRGALWGWGLVLACCLLACQSQIGSVDRDGGGPLTDDAGLDRPPADDGGHPPADGSPPPADGGPAPDGGRDALPPGDAGPPPGAEDCPLATVRCVDVVAGPTQEYATIQAAVDDSVPGDTVLVFPGDHVGFRVDHGGTASAPLMVRAAAAGVNLIGAESGSHNVVRIQNASHVTIEGFRIARDGTSAPYDYDYACIAARGASSDAPMRGLVIRANEVAGCSPAGMYLSQAEGLVVEANHIHDNVRELEVGNGMGIYLANAGCKGVAVRDNVIADNDGAAIHFNGDLSVGGDGLQSGHVLERNLIAGNGDNGFNMDGVQDSLVVNNVFAENGRHGVRDYAIDAAAGPRNLIVVNNTFFRNGDTPLKMSEDLGGHVLFNNLLVDHADNTFTIDESTPQVSHNLMLPADAALFVGAAGRDFRLLAGAAAVDAGTSSFAGHTSPETDGHGFLRTEPPDVGAFELGSPP